MQLVPPLLFGISASLDALLAGISFGVRGVCIRLLHNLLISLITLLGTCLSVGLGYRLTTLLPALFWDAAGSAVLILFGLYYMIKCMLSALKKYRGRTNSSGSPDTMASSRPPSMTFPEACTLGCALSANNMGIGLSASMAGLSLIPAGVVTFLFSLIFLSLGNRLGQCRLLHLAEHISDLISGALLVLLGIWELVG